MKKVIILLALIFLSCENFNNNESVYEDILIDVNKEVGILELEKIESFKMSNVVYNIDNFIISDDGEGGESIIYVDSQQGIVNKLDLQTRNIINIGKSGSGPFEYQMPKQVREFNKKIYVWDASQLKFIVFDNEGNPVRESNTLNRAVSKFDVINKDSLLVKMSGGFEGESVGIFSFNAGYILEESLMGVQEKTDLLLEIFAGTSGVLAEPLTIYYALPGKPVIYKTNLKTNKKSRLIVRTEDFEIVAFEGNVREFVNSDRDGLMELLFNNSATMDLYKHEDLLILKTVNGTTDMSSIGQDNLIQNRFYKFYVIDDKNNLNGHFRMDYKINIVGYYFFGDRFYELVFNVAVAGEHYVLNTYNID